MGTALFRAGPNLLSKRRGILRLYENPPWAAGVTGTVRSLGSDPLPLTHLANSAALFPFAPVLHCLGSAPS